MRVIEPLKALGTSIENRPKSLVMGFNGGKVVIVSVACSMKG